MSLSHALSALTLGAIALAALSPRPSERDEPPQRFKIEGEGQSFEVEAGESFELEVGGQKASFVVRPRDTRRLELKEFSFEYPNHLAFEYEHEVGVQMWTLDGSSVVLMVQRYQAEDLEDTFELVLEQVLGQFGEAAKTEEAPELDVTAEIPVSRRCVVDVGGTSISQDFYALETKGNHSTLLILQDSLDEDLAGSDEMDRVRELLEETFELAESD